MNTRSGKAKGRRLQVELAELLATTLNLCIEAVPPTQPGARANGARYVVEGDGADLRIRRMGEAGFDVSLLTERARARASIGGKTLCFECKNTEALALGGAQFWSTGKVDSTVLKAFRQLGAGTSGVCRNVHGYGVVVVSRNRWPTLAIWNATAIWTRAELFRSFVRKENGGWYFTRDGLLIQRLEDFVRVLDGAI